jgi:hypothetical protein
MWSNFPSAKPAALSRIIGRILLAKVDARTGKDMLVAENKSHGDYNFSVTVNHRKICS